MKPIVLELAPKDVDTILAAIGRLPLLDVLPLYTYIRTQAIKQVSEQKAEEEQKCQSQQ